MKQNSLYVTGDTHGDIDFGKLKRFAKSNPHLTKNDYVLILGDFGAVWNKNTLPRDIKPYLELPFTVLFIDGNHENFDLLESFDLDYWRGGNVRFIAEDIIHLTRGQVFDFGGKTVFTFGGATSRDAMRRTEGVSWWKNETPNETDFEEAKRNLFKVGYKVDFIFTHTCDKFTEVFLPSSRFDSYRNYKEQKYLSFFSEKVTFSQWFFGHHHIDLRLPDRMCAVYNEIIKII